MSYASEVLADAPGGYWRMAEASGLIQDSSGNGNNANASVGTAQYQQASPILSDPADKAIFFDGDATMQVPDHATLDVGDVFSLEAWIKRTTTGITETIFDKWTDTPAIIINSSNEIAFTRTNAATIATSTSTLTDTNWHHIVCTKNGASIFIYLDGVDNLATINNSGACVSDATRLEIGGTQLGTNFCNSRLDELAIYPTVLSAARVLVHYQAATVLPGSGDDPPMGIGGRGAGW